MRTGARFSRRDGGSYNLKRLPAKNKKMAAFAAFFSSTSQLDQR
jgi:hypothetical protein